MQSHSAQENYRSPHAMLNPGLNQQPCKAGPEVRTPACRQGCLQLLSHTSSSSSWEIHDVAPALVIAAVP